MPTQATKIKHQRRIINRLALQQAMVAVVEGETDALDARNKLVGVLKGTLEAGRKEIQKRFVDTSDGAACVLENGFLIDQILRTLFDVATQHLYPAANPIDGERLAMVAVGGYGRAELAPHSDIDLLFLHHRKPAARVDQVVETILYTLWDLGLKVGHATRSVEDCIRKARADWTICTSLLEARYVWGHKPLFTELREKFKKQVVAGRESDFLDAKLLERDERHERMGDSRYVLEPNIKDGKGGSRDLHALYWAAKFLYGVEDIAELVNEGALTRKEVEQFAKAQAFLWTVRCHLHYLARRPEERLTFDVQPELADRMAYTEHAGTSGVERFMKHYFLVAKEVGDLTRIFLAAFEAGRKRNSLLTIAAGLFKREVEGFPLDGQRLSVPSTKYLRENPIEMLRIFKVSNQTGIPLHPNALASITRSLSKVKASFRDDPEANRIFLEILAAREHPDATLREMNECGLFGKFVPDFGRVVAQMQYDMYHVYTTDEHTIRAIGILNRIERGVLQEAHPVASKAINSVDNRELLYTAVLLHDIAKGRGGDHSVLGANVARKLCPRLGFNDADTETIAWLVRHHLAMSMTATKRDLEDPKTIRDFVDLVQSPARLRLLLCLTVVDIKAVGPNVWNNWKAALLRELYWRAEEWMAGESVSDGRNKRIAAAKGMLTDNLQNEGWEEAAIQAHLARGPDAYFLNMDQDTLAHHARILARVDSDPDELVVETRVDQAKAVTELTVYCSDHPGLFARLSGAISLAGATVVDAKIATLKDGMALDTFLLQDAEGGAFARSDRLARLAVMIRQSVSGEIHPMDEHRRRARQAIPSRTQVFTVTPRVIVDNKASNTYTVIEVNGRDRPGLLYRVTTALSEQRCQIATAKISTYGEQVVDVFYVKDTFGMKIDHTARLDQLRQSLLFALSEESDADPFHADAAE